MRTQSKAIRRNSGQSPGRKPCRSSSLASQLEKKSADAVAAWLQQHGHPDAADCFKDNDVTWEMLKGLTDADLKEIGVASLGERKKLLLLIENAVGPTNFVSYSAGHEGSRKPGRSPSRQTKSSGGGRMQPHLSNPAGVGTLMGAAVISLVFNYVIGTLTAGLALLLNVVVWSLSCDGIGAVVVGIQYERVDGTGKAGIGLMAVSWLLQCIFWIFSIGILAIVDVCKVLSSAKRQGITGSMFGIYPVEKSRSVL
jgi:hypothetical protein